jgi:hypothetical protein
MKKHYKNSYNFSQIFSNFILVFLERGDDSAPTGDDESEDDYKDFWNY